MSKIVLDFTDETDHVLTFDTEDIQEFSTPVIDGLSGLHLVFKRGTSHEWVGRDAVASLN